MPVPAMINAMTHTTLREHATSKIRTAILNGTLEAGERLHDDDLIAWLGVSRTPIREALASLAGEGLVEMVAGRYTRVALPDPDDVLDALRTLGLLMGGVIRLAVPVMSDSDRKVALARIDREVGRLEDGGTATLSLAADSAYWAWLTLCPNPTLVATGERVIHGLAYKLRVSSIGELVPVDHLLQYFPPFRQAVRDADPVGAQLAIEALHMLSC